VRKSTDVGRAILVLATCALPCFIAGASIEQVRTSFDFSDAALGVAFAVFWGVAAIASAPAAALVARLGAATSVLIAGATTAASCAVIALFVDSTPALLVVLTVAGSAIAVATPSVNVILMNAVRPGRQATAFGVAQSGPAIALLVAGLAVPAVAAPLGWRWVYVGAGLFALGATLSARRISAVQAAAADQLRSKAHSIRPLALVMIGVTLGYAALGTANAFLVAAAPSAGVPRAVAAVTLAAGAGISIVLRIALGARADRRRDDPLPLAAALLAAGAAGYALLALHAAVPFLVGSLLVLTLGWAWIGLFGWAVISRYASSVESATGVLQTGVFAGGVLGPPAFGLVVQASSFTIAWIVVSVGAVVSAAAILAATRVLPAHRGPPARVRR
jgi:predicted MFS family arabinose efflux permease